MTLDRCTIPTYNLYCDVGGCTCGDAFDEPTKREAAKVARAGGWTVEKVQGGRLWKCPEHKGHVWVRCETCHGTGGGLGHNCHVCQGSGVQ